MEITGIITNIIYRGESGFGIFVVNKKKNDSNLPNGQYL